MEIIESKYWIRVVHRGKESLQGTISGIGSGNSFSLSYANNNTMKQQFWCKRLAEGWELTLRTSIQGVTARVDEMGIFKTYEEVEDYVDIWLAF